MTWGRHGDDMGVTWGRHGDDMGATWGRHGDVVAELVTACLLHILLYRCGGDAGEHGDVMGGYGDMGDP